MAQLGSLGLLASLRLKRGILGSLIWTYIVCPEVYRPFSVTHAHASEDVKDTNITSVSSDDLKQMTRQGKDWAKGHAKNLTDTSDWSKSFGGTGEDRGSDSALDNEEIMRNL